MNDQKISIFNDDNESNKLIAVNSEESDNYPFSDIKYICQATALITESLQKGFDVAQLPNGDISVTEIKIVNVHYNWNAAKQRLIKNGQNSEYY